MAAVGTILTVGGASLAGVTLLLLKAECCPRCGTAGRLDTIAEQVEEIPGCAAKVRRIRRCAECEATVEDG